MLGTDDPYTRRKRSSRAQGAGIVADGAIGQIRNDASWSGGSGKGGLLQLRESGDFIDPSSVTNRLARYKEYERLITMPEIDGALTVFADETCVVGDTPVITPLHGPVPIRQLAETKKPEEHFLVYCYDFEKQDYTLGWAYHPRWTKKAATVTVALDDGSKFTCTPDHRVLLRSGEWITAGELKFGSELMPFHRVPASPSRTRLKTKQFPRVFTHNDGWKTERQFIDQWRSGKKSPQEERLYKIIRYISQGCTVRQVAKLMERDWHTCAEFLKHDGFSATEIQRFTADRPDRRTVVGVANAGTHDVYDLSVKDHQNFASTTAIFHNCQIGENGHYFDIKVKNADVKKELDTLFWNPGLLNMDDQMYDLAKNLFLFGDQFRELQIVPESPKDGVLGLGNLPPETMYRIETVKGKVVEFQQAPNGPDYKAIEKHDINTATDEELEDSNAIRFAPNQIVHFKIGTNRKQFAPYGVSLVEAARAPAHQLRLMEDAMMVYRLCLVGNTRVRTHAGYKYIKDLEVDDGVFSYCANGPFKSVVMKTMDNGIQDVFRVRSRHVEITGTKTHPILVDRNGTVQYVDIQDLRPGVDKLMPTVRRASTPVPIPQTIGEPWAKLSDIQRTQFRLAHYENKSALLRKCENFGRAKQFLYVKNKSLPLVVAQHICQVFGLDPTGLVVVSKNQRNAHRVELPKVVDEDFARLFGFMLGDGFLHNGSQIGFAAGIDSHVNERYQTLLEKYFGVVRFEQDKRLKPGLGKYVVDSSHAHAVFTAMGYSGTHDDCRIPEWAYSANWKIRKALVLGLSDADGTERITPAGTWFSTIELSNLRLVEDVKELWSSAGLSSGHVKTRSRKGGHRLHDRVMPDTISHSVTISELPLPTMENVVSVTPAGQERVFDITVDKEEHNFIANGIPVHNTRAPERRVFYVDVGNMPHFKAEAYLSRMQDLFRKKKTFNRRGDDGKGGGNPVEERMNMPGPDEDFWVPTRPNSNTRIDVLPGAQNLGEIDDALYFRNKLFIALNFPKNYLTNEDPQVTSKSLASMSANFAHQIERFQKAIAKGLMEIALRHLSLRGYPEHLYEDLQIQLTPPSNVRELSEQDLIEARFNRAASMVGTGMFSHYDIMVEILKYRPEKAKEMVARATIQKLQDIKFAVMAQNPQLLGIIMPGQGDQELGAEPGGPNPMLGMGDPGGGPPPPSGGEPPPNGGPPPSGGGSPGGMEGVTPASDTPPPEDDGGQANLQVGNKSKPQGIALPDPKESELKQYDLEIFDYSSEMGEEEIDAIELDEY